MTDAEGPKNDGDEQADRTAPASADAPAAEQAPTDGSVTDAAEVANGTEDEPLYEAAAESAHAAEEPGSAADAGDVAPSDVAPYDAPAAEPELTRSGPEPQTTEFSAEGASGVDAAGGPVSADRRGEDTAPETTDEEPDYEALAAELDRLEADTAAAAPVAPGAREPEPTNDTADPWFEPATSQTFSASEPQQPATLDAPDATPHATSTPPPAAAPGPIFVQAPEPPRKRGNRGAAGLIGLLAAVVFALLFAIANFAWEAFLGWGTTAIGEGATDPATFVTDVLLTPPFWFTVVAFWLSFWLLGVFVNRARWWSWVVLGIIVALLTYVGAIVGHFLEAPFWNLTSDEGVTLLGNLVFSPLVLLAFIIAREVTIWFGSWVSRRGARVTQLNEEERAEYDRVMSEGPKGPASA